MALDPQFENVPLPLPLYLSQLTGTKCQLDHSPSGGTLANDTFSKVECHYDYFPSNFYIGGAGMVQEPPCEWNQSKHVIQKITELNLHSSPDEEIALLAEDFKEAKLRNRLLKASYQKLKLALIKDKDFYEDSLRNNLSDPQSSTHAYGDVAGKIENIREHLRDNALDLLRIQALIESVK